MEHVSAGAETARALGLDRGLVAGDRVWVAHPVDIRVSLPLPFGRYYLTLVAGPERRSAARLAGDRQARPLATAGNLLFFFVSALGINAAAILGVLLYSSVLRF
ncbi:MAG: hypothetical protein IT563_00415 [Alphaproteobacteria bacterium]|nr:hypothetical protein [Alphaproteobacteria bacterium]